MGVEQDRNRALVAWYRNEGRTLPWRINPDPYHVLVAEVMSQQTQVMRIVSHHKRFIRQFPTIEALASAPLGDVLAVWSGLGYNTRAKRLQDTARRISESGWPTTIDGLRTLPGVGPYTASAIAVFAFGAHAATVDTNVRRVVSRWFGEPLAEPELSEAARIALADAPAADWNQAVMDLSAAICRPSRPLCGECPVTAWCAGPDVTISIDSQPTFEGSNRQLRGAVMRAVIRKPHTSADLAAALGADPALLETAVKGLVADGLVRIECGLVEIAD